MVEEGGEGWHGRGRRRGKSREGRMKRSIRRGQLKEWTYKGVGANLFVHTDAFN